MSQIHKEVKKRSGLSSFEASQIKRDWYLSYRKQYECRFMNDDIYKMFFNPIIDEIMKKDLIYMLFYDDNNVFIGWLALNFKM